MKDRVSKTLQVGLTANVLVLKGTQKMITLKDSLSLAYYNLPPQATVTFSLKT